jgi:hypothetical protein
LPEMPPRDDRPILVMAADRSIHGSSVELARPLRPLGRNLQRPDYIAGACALALGLGLMSRPILPDLLALVQLRRTHRRPPCVTTADRTRRTSHSVHTARRFACILSGKRWT